MFLHSALKISPLTDIFTVLKDFKTNLSVISISFLSLCISLDYSKGFGGKYGVQTDRVDKVGRFIGYLNS